MCLFHLCPIGKSVKRVIQLNGHNPPVSLHLFFPFCFFIFAESRNLDMFFSWLFVFSLTHT